MWPPRREDLITIAAGESAMNRIVLKTDIVPPSKMGNRANVVLKGRWSGVWASVAGEVGDESLENPEGSPDAFLGEFESNVLRIEVD